MSTFLAEIRQTIVPGRDSKYGPLPPLMVAMTLVTGLVDSFSYLVLGHVFVANMTGNVVLLGFALVGTKGFSIAASVAGIAAFGLGALIGGKIGSVLGQHRGRLLFTSTTIQVVFLAVAVIVAALSKSPLPAGYRYVLIVVLAAAMGIQNATARELAVPDLTTTVLTLTITGIAADSAIAGGEGSRAGRRLIAVAAMLAGAVVGATFVIHAHIVYPLLIALIVTAIVVATAGVVRTSDSTWVRAES
ncbi:MAG TPA: YoaK family protein [Acidimicrobiales bacterium]|nr:YoaK family protein [Acidimicrobiales bacterium]